MKFYKHNDIPLISIAMCTYNGEIYLRDQLTSLIEQDYRNLEIQIVDDYSTDSTFQILEEFASKYPHIQIYRNEKNLGFRRNFEKALSLCSGEYISLCDQDDIWLPNKISSLYNNIGDKDLVYSNVQLIDENGIKLNREFTPAKLIEGRCHMSLLLDNCVTGHTCLFRRRLLEKALPIPESVKMHDHWLAFVAAATCGIKVHREKLSLYRQHGSNTVLTSNKRKRPSKAKRNLALYRERVGFCTAVLALDWLPAEDLKLIGEVQLALLKYPFCYHNRKLHKILVDNDDKLLAVYREPKKGLRKLCRGGLWDLLHAF